MHVSLPRHYQNNGRSKLSLLWMCLGFLAILPWQMVRGEDEPAASAADREVVEWQQEIDKQLSKDKVREKSKLRKGARNSAETSSKLQLLTPIFRSQTAPPAPDSFGPDAGPDAAPAGQGSQSAPYQLGSTPQDGFMADQRLTSRPGQAFGAQVRASAITGPAIGRDHPIYPIELMPFAFLDNNLFFADVRGFTDTINGWGGNFGGGYRRYLPYFDRILGVNGYYDYDNTSGALFREVGFGVESLGAFYDVRANAYFPTGQTKTLLGLVNVDGTQQFAGHLLLTNQLATYANALHGFDAEIGVPVPGRVTERMDMRVFGGGYWFEGQTYSSFGGWKTRIQANVLPSVALNLQVSHDQAFQTNVVFGATWSFGGYKQSDGDRPTQFGRMTTPVVRQYNMVVAKSYETIKDVVVINPLTDQPYFFEHVDSNATGIPVGGVVGDGTAEHPFTVFQNAQAALSDTQGTLNSNDIIFVHGNSVFGSSSTPEAPIQLQQNVTVLGEASGLDHFIATSTPNSVGAFGDTVRLPHPTSGNSVAAPIFQYIAADPTTGASVILADNSQFNGFQLGNSSVAASGPQGIGIYANGISNAVVRRTDVYNSVGSAVVLNNTSGTITFQGDVLNSPITANTTTMVVTDTAKTGVINFTQDEQPLASGSALTTAGVINNTNGLGGMALEVGGSQTTGTQSGSVVNFTGSLINDDKDTSGKAIDISYNAGTVILGDATITNASGIGLNIFSDSGIVDGNGLIQVGGKTTSGTAIAGTKLDAINITNLTSTGSVIFTNPGSNTTGSFIPLTFNWSGAVLFTEPSGSNGTGSTAGITIMNQNARGINLESNAGNVGFGTPVNITAATQNANQLPSIEYHGNKGNVIFNNTLNITNGGTGILIDPATIGGTSVPNTGVFVVNGATTITTPGVDGVEVKGDSSTVSFGTGASLAVNQAANIGIEVEDNNGPVSFQGSTTVANATGNALPGVDIRGNDAATAVVSFNTLNVNNAANSASAPFGGTGVNIGSSTNAADYNQASVRITSLNINQANTTIQGTGTGPLSTVLFVSHEGSTSTTTPTGLTILGGNITNGQGQAVEINNSVINVTLNQVNSTDAATAIDLVDNQTLIQSTGTTTAAAALTNFMFQLENTANLNNRSTGTISGASTAAINVVQNNTGQDAVQTGLQLFQTGAVNISQVTLNNNNVGVSANGLLSLNVYNSVFFESTHDGISGYNIPHVLVQNSLFQNNGTVAKDTTNTVTGVTTLADNAIYLFANQPLLTAANQNVALSSLPTNGQYQWYIENNANGTNTTGGFFGGQNAGDVVRVDNQANTQSNPKALQVPITSTSVINTGTTTNTLVTGLDFRFANNFVSVPDPTLNSVTTTAQAQYIAGVNVNWTGLIESTSTISNNTVQMANYDKAFEVTNQDFTYATSMSIVNNLVTLVASTSATNTNNTQTVVDYGIYVNNSGPTELTITGNNFTFDRTVSTGSNQDVGMFFNDTNTTNTTSNFNISSNTITMSGLDVSDQGLQFQQLQAPASLFISNNLISITAASATGVDGISFSTILGRIGLSSSANNEVSINGSTNGANGAPFVTGLTTLNVINGDGFIVNNIFVP